MSQRPEYEIAVDEFEESDAAYREFEEQFMSGALLKESILGAPVGRVADFVIEEFQQHMEHMKKLLEDRNAKLQTAKTKMRDAVTLPKTQWRGAETKATTITYKGLSVTSSTRRSFDGPTLMNAVGQHGLLERFMSLKALDEKSGVEKPLVMQSWDINYHGVKNWLEKNGLSEIVKQAYDERENTPSVSGAKPIAFLGQLVKD